MNSEQGTMGSILGTGRCALSEAVPVGYKRTEVGVIPTDWHVTRIGSLFSVKAGGDFDPTNSSEVQGDNYPYPIYANSLSQQGLYGFCNYAQSQIGSITITARGTLGKTFYRNTPFVAIGRLLVLEPRVSMDARFFSEYINYGVHFAVESTGVPQLTAPQVARYSVPVPPEFEQRAIAEMLSDVDGLIQSLDALISKKRAIKQAVMQQLLTGKTRLPGFSGEWETKRLGELADIRHGATPSTQIGAYWNGPIPWCIPTDITATSGKYLLATERSITKAGLASCRASLLPVGALLLCSRTTIGEIKIATFPVCTNQGFKSLVCKDNVSNEFLYYLLLTLKPQMIERATGSTFLEIGKRDLASIELSVPPESEQCAIAAILSDMDAEIAALERRRDKTHAIKQGMMQQLLTGRVRLVSNPERE